MTIDEKIKLLESQIAETNKLLAEIKQEKENEEKKNTDDVFSSKDEADKMVEWLKRKNKYGEFIAEEFEIAQTFNPDNYI